MKIAAEKRNARRLLAGPTGGSVDTSTLDAEMIAFLLELGSISSVTEWTE